MAHQCRDRKAWLPCLSLAQFPRSRAPGLVVASIMYQFSPLSSRAFLASLQGCLQRPQPDKCMHLRVTFQGALSKKCNYPVWIKPTVNPEEKGNGVGFRWEHRWNSTQESKVRAGGRHMKADTRLGSGSLKLKSSPRSSRTGATNARTQRTRQGKPRMEVKCVCLFAGARARMVGFKGPLYPPSPHTS